MLMRSPITLLVVGALLVIGLVAAVDGLRGDSPSAPVSVQTEDVTTERRPEAAAGPPAIEDARAVAGELAAARINGTLYLTDARCRLWTLQLPDLAWRSLDDEPSSECRFAVSATGQHLIGNADWSPTGHLGAAERETDGGRPRILVISDATDWTFSFAGSAPAFRPDGALTFVRRGTLWGWVEGPCQPGARARHARSTSARLPARVGLMPGRKAQLTSIDPLGEIDEGHQARDCTHMVIFYLIQGRTGLQACYRLACPAAAATRANCSRGAALRSLARSP